MFQRAIAAYPQHRENLEEYAFFLNVTVSQWVHGCMLPWLRCRLDRGLGTDDAWQRDNKPQDSLSLYQRSLLQYSDHYRL